MNSGMPVNLVNLSEWKESETLAKHLHIVLWLIKDVPNIGLKGARIIIE